MAMNGIPIQVANERPEPDGLLCHSLEDALSRIAALTFCGVWHTDEGDYAVFDDRGTSGSSFLRLARRYDGSPVK
jgi:hypothetical protein